jgi:hypothetical protein
MQGNSERSKQLCE